MVGKPRYHLAWIVCLLLLTGFLANSVSSYFVSRANVRKTITESSLPLTSDNIYSVIQRDILRPIFISSMMANDAFLRDWTLSGEQEIDRIQRYLSEIRREYETVSSFFVSEQTRNYYYAGGILKQVSEDEPRDVWYFRVREMEEPFEINVDPDLANRDAMTIFINYRVFDFDGKFIGAAGTGLTINRVNALIEEYETRFGRHIFFCDSDGQIVLSTQKSRLSGYDTITDIPGLAAHAKSLLTEPVENLTYDRNGERYFLNSRFVPELNWFLMVEQTEDILLAPLRETLLLNICLALLITAVIAFVCISAINRHQKKLEARNQELSSMNDEVERQKRQLQQTAQELEQANAALNELNQEKDDFLGLVAHDLRNPLNGMLGFCEEIKRELPPERQDVQGFLDEMRTAGNQMLELIEDILNVSAIESFRGPLHLRPFNWNQIARDAVDRFHTQAERKEITLRLQLDENAEIEIPTRDNWLAICLNNLVSNALKYAPPATEVTVQTHLRADRAEIRVIDQGVGLKPDEIDRAFGKFVKLSAQPTGGESSSGLGLYIVQKMCQRLGASVSVESEYGAGASFIIEHPLHRPEANAAVPATRTAR